MTDLSNQQVIITLNLAANGTAVDSTAKAVTLIDDAGNMCHFTATKAVKTSDRVWRICIGSSCVE